VQAEFGPVIFGHPATTFQEDASELSLAAIQQGVHAFAESAGVTLRRPKAGRGAKKI
jgi:hypothetical protein